MHSPAFVRTVIGLALPLAAIASIVLAINYINNQQTLRMLANEPQEYVARNAATLVTSSGNLPRGGFNTALPIETDPAPYLIFYDATGTPVGGTGVLKSGPPTLPAGVLDTARAKGVNRITWEPTPGARQALVIVPVAQGYVVAGRSLAYNELQQAALTKRTELGWLATMVASLAVAYVGAWILRRRPRTA
jgi:hypothetical protein